MLCNHHHAQCFLTTMTTPIPQPPAIPFLGNVHQMDTEFPVRGLAALAKTYGEIYKVNILGR